LRSKRSAASGTTKQQQQQQQLINELQMFPTDLPLRRETRLSGEETKEGKKRERKRRKKERKKASPGNSLLNNRRAIDTQ
jgi:hypothetical protein